MSILLSISDNKKTPFKSDDNKSKLDFKSSMFVLSNRIKLCLIKKFPFRVSVNCLDSTILHLYLASIEEILATIPI